MYEEKSPIIKQQHRNSKLRQKENAKKNVEKDDIKMNVINYEKYETLNIVKNSQFYVQTDRRFVHDIRWIVKIRNKNALTNIQNIMKSELTDLQCDEIDYLARLHAKANTLNSNTKVQYNSVPQQDRCKCGCMRSRGNSIPIFVDQQNLNILGPGILLLFLYMRAITASLLIIVCIYSLFGFITNLLGHSARIQEACSQDLFCLFKTRASDQNKQYSTNYNEIQQWLGLAFCVVWVLVMRYIKFAGKIKNKVIDSKLKSDSDYAIKIQYLPQGYYQEKQLIAMLESSWQNIIKSIKKKTDKTQRQKLFLQHLEQNSANPLKMRSIQIIYNMQFARSMLSQLLMEITTIDSLIVDKDNKFLVSKIDQYRKAKTRIKQTYELLIDLRKKFLNDPEFRKGLSTTCCIIEFHSKKNRQILLQHFGREKVSLIKQFKSFVLKFFLDRPETIQFKGKTLQIERAPQPSDILWQNCQKKWEPMRIIYIYLATFLVILFSFGLMTGLNFLQDYLKKNPQTSSNASLMTAMNYIMSIAMLVINKLMWFGLFYLLNIEYNHTLTDKIISQMNKVLFLCSVNVIVLPILSNYIVMGRGFLYGNDGLAGLAFDYHITGIVQAVMMIFDPMMLIKKVLITIRFTRYKLIRVFSPPRLEGDYYKGVQEVKPFYEGQYFDVAQNYVKVTSAILHAVFFCQLQPFIIVLVTIMMAVFYFANRIKLLRICKIPQMTDYLVFDTGIFFLCWVPLFYGAGTITLSFLQNRENSYYQFRYIGGIICLIIGVINLSNPADFLNKFVIWSLPKLKCINLFQLMGDNAQDNVDDEDQSYSNFDIKQKQDQSNQQSEVDKKKQEQYQKQQLKSANNRLEGYYKNSNALNLLGFEQQLKQNQIQKKSYEQLKIFCQSFFPETDVINEIEMAGNVIKFADSLIKTQAILQGFGKKQDKVLQKNEGSFEIKSPRKKNANKTSSKQLQSPQKMEEGQGFQGLGALFG